MQLSPSECMASSALLSLASSTGGEAAQQQHGHGPLLTVGCKHPKCYEKFDSIANLKHHASIHKDERPFNCGVCDKTFRKGSDLKRHLRIHTGERPYVCEICSRAFAEAGSLHRHERCHTGEKPFACSVCCQLFCRAYNARKHTLKHDPSIKLISTTTPIKSDVDREMDILAQAGVVASTMSLITKSEYSSSDSEDIRAEL
uniref:C2H2-type domain-containing protein n=1 Tax=Spongospora subterranea TaxID=70186 RepID=A0A0H5RT31_9EUKA|eukprot:CRZ11889.1 hypothetical protein [Spongospora subterranea]